MGNLTLAVISTFGRDVKIRRQRHNIEGHEHTPYLSDPARAMARTALGYQGMVRFRRRSNHGGWTAVHDGCVMGLGVRKVPVDEACSRAGAKPGAVTGNPLSQSL
jgi:hypothetical protein